MVEAGPPFGVTFVGENVHPKVGVKFPQENVTAWLKPFAGVTVITVVPGVDFVAVSDAGFADSVNDPVAAIVTCTALDVDGE